MNLQLKALLTATCLLACFHLFAIENPFSKANSTYRIQHDIDLKGSTIKVPANCTLDFSGGRILNGRIICDGTTLTGQPLLLCDVEGFITNQEVYVKWFGAKGDNKSDDTQAIQRAVNSLCGNTLVFNNSSSYYYVTNTIVLSQQQNRPNRIEMNFASDQGSGIRVDEKFAAGKKDCPIFVLNSITSGYTIDGLCIYGTKKRTGVGIQLNGSCRDIRISNYFANGIFAAIETSKGSYYNYLNAFHFYNCEYGILITGGEPQGSFKVDSGKVSRCSYGVYCDANCNDVVFTGITLEANAYKIFTKRGSLFFQMPYLGDESKCNVYIDGGSVTINSPTSPIGAVGTGSYKLSDQILRYGIVVRNGSLTLSNATFDGNFSNYAGDGYYTAGASLLVDNGELHAQNVRFSKHEQNYLSATNNRSTIYLDRLHNYVINGNFSSMPKLEERFTSKAYGDCSSKIDYLKEENGMGGRIIRLTPSTQSSRWGIRFPYSITDTSGVKYIRLKLRFAKDYSDRERKAIENKLSSSSINLSGGSIITQDQIKSRSYSVSYPINVAWHGYTPALPFPKTISGLKKDFVFERVLPVKVKDKSGFIELILSQDNGEVSSSTSSKNYLNCAIDIFHVALLDEEEGNLLGRL